MRSSVLVIHPCFFYKHMLHMYRPISLLSVQIIRNFGLRIPIVGAAMRGSSDLIPVRSTAYRGNAWAAAVRLMAVGCFLRSGMPFQGDELPGQAQWHGSGMAAAAPARLQHGRSGHHVGGRLDLSNGVALPYSTKYQLPAGSAAVFPVHTAPAVCNLVRTRRDSPKCGSFGSQIRGGHERAEERAMSTAVAINFNQAIT